MQIRINISKYFKNLITRNMYVSLFRLFHPKMNCTTSTEIYKTNHNLYITSYETEKYMLYTWQKSTHHACFEGRKQEEYEKYTETLGITRFLCACNQYLLMNCQTGMCAQHWYFKIYIFKNLQFKSRMPCHVYFYKLLVFGIFFNFTKRYTFFKIRRLLVLKQRYTVYIHL
jgi:hypothetical protein